MHKITLNQGNEQTNFEVETTQGQKTINQEVFDWDFTKLNESTFHVVHQDQSFTIEVVKADLQEKSFQLKINGEVFNYTAKDRMDLLLEKMGMSSTASAKVNQVKAPMPGLIVSIKVEAGQAVQKGDILLILEAMKMENVIKSPTDATIKAIKIKQGENVEKNKVLIEFE
ncbi:MAG: acetyl-CoA carboxylase biotin carboxyl carrier protein subunit [Raineya sp.]|jgi:biotin carboxyl carrier protein|nr:acetyl-CoA carboxylase biotin carboxyl carrier protein subunit [Raineya sp.]